MEMTSQQSETRPLPAEGLKRNFADQVAAGLRKLPKELPYTYLYDELGSALFEAITLLPEYGLTRAERRLYAKHGEEIVQTGHFPSIIELGSGSGQKTKLLLANFVQQQGSVTYTAIDASHGALKQCAAEMSDLRSVRCEWEQGDYLPSLERVRRRNDSPCLVIFAGSSLGNLDPAGQREFLGSVRRILRPGDAFLLGTDLVKNTNVLTHAYHDSIGLTAAFCRNILSRINRELGGNFDIGEFRYVASWCEEKRRIEMRLVASSEQKLTIPASNFRGSIQQGEYILVETSHKFTAPQVISDLRDAGFEVIQQWIDAEWPFSETLAVVPSAGPFGPSLKDLE